MVDPEILPALQLVRGQSICAVHLVEFLSAFVGGPLRYKSGQCFPDFVAVHSVAALVRPAARSIFDAAAGYDLGNNLSELADAVVLRRLANVEGLIVNCTLRRFEHAEDGGHNVADVDNRTPGRSVALDINAARGHGRSDEIVQHQIQPEAW